MFRKVFINCIPELLYLKSNENKKMNEDKYSADRI